MYATSEPDVSGKSLKPSEDDRIAVNAILERYIALF